MELIEYSMQIIPLMLSAAKVTLKLFFITIVLSLPLGLIISLIGMSKFKPFKFIVWLYTWVLRGTPLLLQMFFVYFALPYVPFIGVTLGRFESVALAFVLNYAAYFSEIFRGGIESIDNGQYEACKALGYTKTQTMVRIIIPQTIKRVLPPISNETITLVKDTSLAAFLAVPEILKVAKDAVNRDTNAIPYFLAALMYLALTVVIIAVFKFLENKYSYYEKRDN